MGSNPDSVAAGYVTETYHFVLLPGAWQPKEVYEEFSLVLKGMGHTAVIAESTGHDISRTIYDDADMAVEAAGSYDNVVPLAHSRGGLVLPYMLAKMDDQCCAAAFLINSGGPQSLELEPAYDGEPELPRYQPGFEKGMIRLSSGLTIFDEELADHFFYHDVKDKHKVAEIIKKLRPERDPPTEQPPLLPSGLPFFSIRGRFDPVHNQLRGQRLDHQWLKAATCFIDTGHTPHLSQPLLLAHEVIRLAGKAAHSSYK